MSTQRLRGTVCHFGSSGPFGFIHPDGASKDIFVHRSGLRPQRGIQQPTLTEGQRVNFTVAAGSKGLCAVDVQVDDGVAAPLTRRAAIYDVENEMR